MKTAIGCLILLLTIAVAETGCTKDKTAPQPPSQSNDSCSMNIKYSIAISAIVNRSCSLPYCHATNGYKDFTTYSLLKAEIDSRGSTYVISRISTGGGMPPTYSPGPALSNCEITKVVTWLNAGYPDN